MFGSHHLIWSNFLLPVNRVRVEIGGAQVIIPWDYNMQNHQQTTTKTTNFEGTELPTLWKSASSLGSARRWFLYRNPMDSTTSRTPEGCMDSCATCGDVSRNYMKRWKMGERCLWHILRKHSWTYLGPFRLVVLAMVWLFCRMIYLTHCLLFVCLASTHDALIFAVKRILSADRYHTQRHSQETRESRDPKGSKMASKS